MSKRSAASVKKAAPPIASATANVQAGVVTASSRGRASRVRRTRRASRTSRVSRASRENGSTAYNAVGTSTDSTQQSVSSPQPTQVRSIADRVKARQRGDPPRSNLDIDTISRGLAKASFKEQAEDVSTAQQPQPQLQPQPQPQLAGNELEKRIYMRMVAMNKRHSGDPGLSKFNGSFDPYALFEEHSKRVREQVRGHAIFESICEMYVEIYDSTYASWCLDDLGLGDLGEDEVKRILVLGLVSLQSNAIRLQSLAIGLEAARILCASFTTADLVALLHSNLSCDDSAERMRSIDVIKAGLEGNCIGPDTDTPAIPIRDVTKVIGTLLERRPKGLTAFKKLATVTTSTFFTHFAAGLCTKKNERFVGKDVAEVANMIRHQVSGDDYYYLTEQINKVFKDKWLNDLSNYDVVVDSVMTNIGSHLVIYAVDEAATTCQHPTEQENEQFLRYNYFEPMFDVDIGAFGKSASLSKEQRADLTVAGSDSGYVRPDFYIKVGYLAMPSSCKISTGIDTEPGVLALLGEFKQSRKKLYIDEQKVVELVGLNGAKLALLCVPKDVTDFAEAEALRWHTVLADGEPALHYGESRLRLMKLGGNLAGCMVYREYDTRTVQLDVTAATPSGRIEVTPKLFDGIIEHLTILHGSVAPSSRSIERIARKAQAVNFEANKSAFISTSTTRFIFAK
ncbi:hypothetical protein GQ42DRAFT_171559 [Ramicandelaber brevisporus]|nr:hypothetical protein GQ42DRAFT_171559 [Ramicandelaber brevisporus]